MMRSHNPSHVDDEKQSRDLQSAMMIRRKDDSGAERNEQNAVGRDERNPERSRRCIDRRQLTDGLRYPVVPVPLCGHDDVRSQIDNRGQNSAGEQKLSHGNAFRAPRPCARMPSTS